MSHNTQHILPLSTSNGTPLSAEDIIKQSEQISLGEELIEKYKAMMHDIADMEQQFLLLQKHLYEQESLCISMLQILSEPLFWYNTNYELLGFNKEFCSFFQLDEHTISHRSIQSLLPVEVVSFITKDDEKPKNVENRLLEYSFQGKTISLFMDKTPLYTKENTLQGYMVYLINATELRKKDEQIEYQATHDELTGLLNRFAIQNKIQEALDSTVSFATVLLDVDKFSDINKIDVALGDEYLQVMAHRLESIFPHNAIAHVGGDEFIILFLNISKPRLENILKEALILLSPPIVLNEYEFLQQYTFSVTFFPKDGRDVDILWQNLLITMEHAKTTNSKISFFKKSFAETIHLQSKRREEIKRALAAHDVINAYQPRINRVTGDVVAFEALARIRSVDGSITLPSEFIVEAEHSDLIHELGRHVLHNACVYAMKLQEVRPDNITVSVNISAKQFSMDLVHTIDEVMKACHMNPHQLELEITESVMIRDIKKARTILEHITSRGIRIAIDDFGKGYSSLYYLKDLPIHTLKIDKDFTQDAFSNPRSAAIIKTVIALGNDLGMDVVAEGIEIQEHFNGIQKYNCSQLQGDYISPPLLEEQAFLWLSKQKRST